MNNETYIFIACMVALLITGLSMGLGQILLQVNDATRMTIEKRYTIFRIVCMFIAMIALVVCAILKVNGGF